MLDITSYRRKSKNVQPLTLMREFYYDYSKSSRTPLKSPTRNDTQSDPLFRRTLSVQKFNKSFLGLQALTDRKISQNINKKENSSTKVLFNKSKSIQKILAKQPGTFKQYFSNNVPFLKAHSSIKCPTQPLQSSQSINQAHKNCEMKNIFYKKKKINLRNQTNLFKQMCQQKQAIEKMRSQKKEKCRQVRQNWIINNLYLKHEGRVQTSNINRRCRVRDRFQATKQNIFPTS